MQTCREHQVNVLDCTTACVCSDVPDAMLVRAQAASNCREGLQNRERQNEHQINMYKTRAPHTGMTRVLLVISVQTVHQDGQNPRLDQVVNGRVAVTRQQLPAR